MIHEPHEFKPYDAPHLAGVCCVCGDFHAQPVGPRCACCMLPVSQCKDHEFDRELERIDREKDTTLTCPNCDASSIEYAPVVEHFEYGASDPVTLTTTVIQGSCRACGFQWTDERAEIARDAAVRKHLQRSDS